MYRMEGLLSTLPVGKDMEQLLNYLNNMLMSASVRRYDNCCYAVLLTLVYYVVAILGYVLCLPRKEQHAAFYL